MSSNINGARNDINIAGDGNNEAVSGLTNSNTDFKDPLEELEGFIVASATSMMIVWGMYLVPIGQHLVLLIILVARTKDHQATSSMGRVSPSLLQLPFC